jgi:hypothetical protein
MTFDEKLKEIAQRINARVLDAGDTRFLLAVVNRQRAFIDLVEKRGAGPMAHRLEATQCLNDCEKLARGEKLEG